MPMWGGAVVPKVKPQPGLFQLNRSHPLARGLFLDLLLNEGSGTSLRDSSGNTSGGFTLNAGGSWSSGVMGPALLTAGGGCASGTSATIWSNMYEQRTLAVWVTPSAETGDWGNLLQLGEAGCISYYPWGDKYAWRTITRDGGWALDSLVTSSVTYVQGALTLVVCTFDRPAKAIYVNGVLAGSTSWDKPLSTVSPTAVVVGGVWYGRVERGMAWGRALTTEEVRQLWIQPFAMYQHHDLAWMFESAAAGRSRISIDSNLWTGGVPLIRALNL